MSVLDKLKVIDGGERHRGYDPVRVRRRKLAEGLADQLKLLEALEEGGVYQKGVTRRERDLETDQIQTREVRRTVSPWWWIDDAGQVQFALRYGSARLKVKDGKDTFVLPTLNDLRQLLPPLRQEVLTGALDAALAEAASGLQARFATNKAAKPKA
jgi:hypothetical protein